MQEGGDMAMVGECLVLLFVLSGCGSCSTAKAYFESRGIPYQVVDVSREREKARLYGIWGVPSYVLLKGNVPLVRFSGFDRSSFERYYRHYCL